MKKLFLILFIHFLNINAFNATNIGNDIAKGIVAYTSELPWTDYSSNTGKNLINGATKAVITHISPNSEFMKQFKNFSNEIDQEIIQKLFINNAKKMALITFLSATGYLTAMYAIPALIKAIERRYTEPKLIIESSKKSLLEKIKSPLLSFKINTISAMIFSEKLKQELDDIIKITSTIHAKIKAGATNIKYRNLLLYGPSGTGKTMFAKKLAKESGLEYAFISGPSFAKFQESEALNALDELFFWAEKSNGLVLFIDEAESFLYKRENMPTSSKAYLLLNSFLNHTNEHSSHFMIIFATNRKDVLDSAIYRRIDDLIEMPLPEEKQRYDALITYRDSILINNKQNNIAFIRSVEKNLNNNKIEAIAKMTAGLSYADLAGIINMIQTDTLILEPAVVTPQLIDIVVNRAIIKHKLFTTSEAKEHNFTKIAIG